MTISSISNAPHFPNQQPNPQNDQKVRPAKATQPAAAEGSHRGHHRHRAESESAAPAAPETGTGTGTSGGTVNVVG